MQQIYRRTVTQKPSAVVPGENVHDIRWDRIAWHEMREGDVCLCLNQTDDNLSLAMFFQVKRAPHMEEGREVVQGKELNNALFLDYDRMTGPRVGLYKEAGTL